MPSAIGVAGGVTALPPAACAGRCAALLPAAALGVDAGLGADGGLAGAAAPAAAALLGGTVGVVVAGAVGCAACTAGMLGIPASLLQPRIVTRMVVTPKVFRMMVLARIREVLLYCV
jgi:hypothetical protein